MCAKHPRARRVIGWGSLCLIMTLVAACSPDDAAPAEVASTTMLPERTEHRVEPVPAAQIGAQNTGVRGAIAAGLIPGDTDDPYGGLTPLEGEVVIDEVWLEENNGGARVVEGFDLRGSLVVEVPDVTIRYCRVQSDDSALYAVQNNGGGDGSRLEIAWCEVDFESPTGKAVLGRNMSIYRTHVSGGQDGIHVNDGGATPGPVTIEQSFIHDQFRPAEHHSDGIQFNGDPGGPVRIVGNKVINHLNDANAPLMFSGVEDALVAENYLWGGVYFMVGGVDGTLVSRDNQFAWGSTLFGMYGVSGDVRVEGDFWAGWVDAEAIDADGRPIPLPTMPDDGDAMIGQPVIDDQVGDP